MADEAPSFEAFKKQGAQAAPPSFAEFQKSKDGGQPARPSETPPPGAPSPGGGLVSWFKNLVSGEQQKPSAVEAETGIPGARAADPSAREEQGRPQEGSTWKPPLGMEQRRAEAQGYPPWIGEGGVPIPTGDTAQKVGEDVKELSGFNFLTSPNTPEKAMGTGLATLGVGVHGGARPLPKIGEVPREPPGGGAPPAAPQEHIMHPERPGEPGSEGEVPPGKKGVLGAPGPVNDNLHPGKIKDDFQQMLEEERVKILKPANKEPGIRPNPELSGGTDVTDFKRGQDLTQAKPRQEPANDPVAPKPPGGGVGAEVAPPETPPPSTPKQSYIDELADKFNQVEKAGQADKIAADKVVKSMPKEALDPKLQEKFTAADEGDNHPDLMMTPEERALYDKYHAAMKPKEEGLYQDMLDKDIAEDDMNPHYAHRMVKGKSPAFDKHALPETDVITSNRVGSGKLSQTTSSMQGRRYFAIERKDGVRKVVHINKDGHMHIVENGKELHDEPIKLAGQGHEFVPGVKVKAAGHEWEIKQAYTRELNEHSGHEYYATGTANTIHNITRMQNALRVRALLKSIENSPEFEAYSTPIRERGNYEEGWRQVHDAPDPFKGRMWHPDVADFLDDIFKKRPTDWYAKAAQFTVRALFDNPVPHMMNVGVHWYVARGWDWITPRGLHRLVTTGVEAAHQVFTHGPKFQEMLREGSSLMSAPIETRQFYERLMKRFGESIEKNPERYGKAMRAMGLNKVGDFVAAYYRAANRMMWRVSDFFMMQRVLELQKKGLTMKEAIKDAEKHIPNYRVPTKVFGSRGFQEIMTDPRWLEFSRYHYGMVNSFVHMGRDIVKGTAKQKFDAMGNMLAASSMLFFIYPLMDKVWQDKTGNPNSKLTRRGASTLPQDLIDLYKLYGENDHENGRTLGQVISSLITPNPLSKEILLQSGVLGARKDSFTGQDISPAGMSLEGAVESASHAMNTLIPPTNTLHQAFQRNKQASGGASGFASQLAAQLGRETLGGTDPTAAQEKGKGKAEKYEKQAIKRRRKSPQGFIEDLLVPRIVGNE